MTSSWRRKLHRAEEHLDLVKRLISFDPGRQSCAVTVESDPDGNWECRVAIAGDVDPLVPIVVGDCLFNIRSALDHLLCALIPSEDKGTAQFPIFKSDPLAMDDANGKWRDTRARNRWLVQTRGVPDEALAVLTELQPFNQARYGAQRAEYHTLAILQALQNADKHRQLIVKGHAIKQMTVWLPEPLSSFSFVVARGSGARILTADEKLEVKADGVFCVPMSTGRNEGFEIPFSIDRVLDFTAQQILPNLEPLLPDPII